MTLTREQGWLKIDLDNTPYEQAGTVYETIKAKLKRAGYVIAANAIMVSPSGHGLHVMVRVEPRPRSPYEVVALQAICGSDPWREAMQMHRARNLRQAPAWMRDAWNVLYAPHPARQRRTTLKRKER